MAATKLTQTVSSVPAVAVRLEGVLEKLNSDTTGMTLSARVFTTILGLLMLVSGLAIYVEPFRTMYMAQIVESYMPYPTLAYWGGQLGAIVAGVTLLSVVLFRSSMKPGLASGLFIFGHVIVLAIMRASVYVHLQPTVPAEAFLFEVQPPVFAILVVLLVALNLYINTASGQLKTAD